MFARKLTEEELRPSSSVGGGKVEDRSSMPLEATVFATGSDEPSNWEHLGTMTGGPVTTGPPLGSGDAEVVQQRQRKGNEDRTDKAEEAWHHPTAMKIGSGSHRIPPAPDRPVTP